MADFEMHTNEKHSRMVSSGLLRREPHGVTTQKTPFFIVTAVKTSNLTKNNQF
jgi:hypothetical protein